MQFECGAFQTECAMCQNFFYLATCLRFSIKPLVGNVHSKNPRFSSFQRLKKKIPPFHWQWSAARTWQEPLYIYKYKIHCRKAVARKGTKASLDRDYNVPPAANAAGLYRWRVSHCQWSFNVLLQVHATMQEASHAGGCVNNARYMRIILSTSRRFLIVEDNPLPWFWWHAEHWDMFPGQLPSPRKRKEMLRLIKVISSDHRHR